MLSSKPVLTIPAAVWQEITAYLTANQPQEACGLLAGQGAHTEAFYPIPNVAPDPAVAFLGEQRAATAALKQMYRDGQQWIATLHSHPPGEPAQPSPVDIARSVDHPGIWQVIAAPLPDGTFDVRAFRIQNRAVVELAVVVV